MLLNGPSWADTGSAGYMKHGDSGEFFSGEATEAREAGEIGEGKSFSGEFLRLSSKLFSFFEVRLSTIENSSE